MNLQRFNIFSLLFHSSHSAQPPLCRPNLTLKKYYDSDTDATYNFGIRFVAMIHY